MNNNRKFTMKDCGLFMVDVALKGYFKEGEYVKLVDVQQGGTLLVVKNQKGVVAELPPLCFRNHLTRLSAWKSKDGMKLLIKGDPREYEDTEMRLFDKDGKQIADWIQNWTEFDDDGCKCHYGAYAPWTELFLSDIEDAGCEDIPDNIELLGNFKHYRVKDDEWCF
jgi:hypothetical protein